MLSTLVLALALALQSPPQRPPQEPPKTPHEAPPDPARVEAAVAELDAAFAKDGTPQKRVEAIAKGLELVDARVIDAISKGLGDKDPSVTLAAADALGRMHHPSSLEALHAWYRKDKKRLAEDMALMPAAIKAIGRHGNPGSIALLKDAPFDQRAFPAAQARVMALGNIRTNESLEELLDLSKKVGPQRMDGLRQDMRIALGQLAGIDLGPDSTAWLKWWQDNKKSFKVEKQPPKLEGMLQNRWDRYWSAGEAGTAGEGEGSPGRRRKGGDEPKRE